MLPRKFLAVVTLWPWVKELNIMSVSLQVRALESSVQQMTIAPSVSIFSLTPSTRLTTSIIAGQIS